jgi:hypothetical protein
MEPGEGVRTETDHPGADASSRSSQGGREARREIIWGLVRLCLIMVAAFMGFMAVEAARAIF